jgi:hypothetical protein
VFINGMHISLTFIKHHLRLVPTITSSQLDSLFNNSDHQNVLKAHALLKGISDASWQPEVSAQVANKPFVLLGELFVMSHQDSDRLRYPRKQLTVARKINVTCDDF